MYTTANGVTSGKTPFEGTNLVSVQDYHDAAEDAPQSRLDAVLRRAETVVRTLAPPPEGASPGDASDASMLASYRQAAADAELAAFEFLWENPGYVVEDKLLDATTKYAKLDALASVVQNSMGHFYVGTQLVSPEAGGEAYASVSNVSPEPLW